MLAGALGGLGSMMYAGNQIANDTYDRKNGNSDNDLERHRINERTRMEELRLNNEQTRFEKKLSFQEQMQNFMMKLMSSMLGNLFGAKIDVPAITKDKEDGDAAGGNKDKGSDLANDGSGKGKTKATT